MEGSTLGDMQSVLDVEDMGDEPADRLRGWSRGDGEAERMQQSERLGVQRGSNPLSSPSICTNQKRQRGSLH